MENFTEIQQLLYGRRDEEYAEFQRRLVPNVPKESIIGVRTPVLRKLAAELKGTPLAAQFLETLPHAWYDENQLHAFLLEKETDFTECIEKVEKFLPYVDNWATCDQLSPKIFRKNLESLLPLLKKWIHSPQPYTIRFGIEILMTYYLEKQTFRVEYAEWVAGVRSEEYYVNMMAAWFFATALFKQYSAILLFFTERKLPLWVQNKAIQKAIESRRITPEQKEYLKALKQKSREGETK